MRLWPEPPGVDSLWRAYFESFKRLGNDPAIGRKLPSLLHASGLQPLRITWIYFGACAGEDVFPLYVDNLIGVIAGAREQILGSGVISEGAFDESISELRKWQNLADASFWYARAWAEARKLERGT